MTEIEIASLLNQATFLIGKVLIGLTSQGCSGDCSKCDNQTGGSTGQPTPTPDQATFYGKDGVTDSGDPRQTNARSHATGPDGRPTAVWLTVLTQPSKRFDTAYVEFLPHDESCNIYVTVFDSKAQPLPLNNVRMITGWQESATSFDKLIDAPGSPGNFFMGSDAKFYPPSLGPLAVCVLDDQGNIDSDIVGSMGLPNGNHGSYRVTFVERS